MARLFAPLPPVPDHPALEQEVLAWWERERIFEQLREQNRGGPRFSFVDGPVTANRDFLGVHTAWGRTLKDVFQRYKALRGFDQRYQNGFDCQGLWIEGGVRSEQRLPRRAHRVGADAEGRLPALQGAPRLRSALPERLRLPGALDRGRRPI